MLTYAGVVGLLILLGRWWCLVLLFVLVFGNSPLAFLLKVLQLALKLVKGAFKRHGAGAFHFRFGEVEVVTSTVGT